MPVFHLLNTYVGTKENIKSLHFEWICGGESGEGLAQRNRYILPAPFVAAASDMVDPSVALKGSSLLALPHVTSLSLKNCWLSPHVFLHVMNTMVDSSLSDLQLEMVSLTAPPCRQSREPVTQPAIEAHWPWPLCNGATPGRTYSLRNGGVDPAAPQVAILNVGPQTYVAFAAAIYQPPGQMQPINFAQVGNPGPFEYFGSVYQSDGGYTHTPRMFSWAHILSELTPHHSILDVRAHIAKERYMEIFDKLNQRTRSWVGNWKASKELKTLQFRSCGYVVVDDAHVDNRLMLGNREMLVEMDENILHRLRECDKEMLIYNDGLLGKIVDFMEPAEKKILRMRFGLTAPSPQWDPAPFHEGFINYGVGRFSGVINCTPTT